MSKANMKAAGTDAKHNAQTPADIAKGVASASLQPTLETESAKKETGWVPNEMTLRPARSIAGFVLPTTMMDVRGWKVVMRDQKSVGTVDSYMVDSLSNQVRWIAVGLDASLQSKKEADALSAVLIPVGRLLPMKGEKTVILDEIGEEQLAKAPGVDSGSPVTRQVEDATLSAYALPTSTLVGKGMLYSRRSFDPTHTLTKAPVAQA